MYSNSLIPTIYKPTRETSTTTTLINNIYTNRYSVDKLLLQGLLIADISDHHAIFHIKNTYIPKNDQFQLIRLGIRFIYCHTIHSDTSYYRSTTDHMIKTSKETHLIQNYLETNIPDAWDCCNICIYIAIIKAYKQTNKKSIINTFVSSFPIRKKSIM